jgi:hypothetical protein
MAAQMVADGWVNVKRQSDQCRFYWWHNDSEWGACLNRQQVNPGTCTWDCFGVAEHHVVGCAGNGVRTRPCCDETPHIVYGEWGPACNDQRMTQTRTAECQACGEPAEGCEVPNQPTVQQCKYKCVNPAAVSVVSMHHGWASRKNGEHTCVQSMALHSQLKPMVSGCCKGADEVHRLDIANGECITGVHGYIGMVVDWVEFSTPSRSIKKGSGALSFSQQAPPGKCLGSVPLSHHYWHDVREVCVVMGVDHIVWVDQYIECDELRDPTVHGRDLTNVRG